MQGQQPSSSLLVIPYLPFSRVLDCLEDYDKLSVARTCRGLAAAVSAASQHSHVSVTSETRWIGLRKLLASNTITCQTMEVCGQFPHGQQPDDDKAVSVLLQPEGTGWLFHGTKKVTISDVGPLPCLLPPNIARLLPDLEELSVSCSAVQRADLEPIQPCSTLRSIKYSGCLYDPQRGSREHHTAENFRKNLPNIDSLTLSEVRTIDRYGQALHSFSDIMLQAWGDQLTKLELDSDSARNMTSAKLKHCTRLQSFAWCYRPSVSMFPNHASTLALIFCPLTFPSSNLTQLKLGGYIDENIMPTVLKHTSIRMLTIGGFALGLHRDWSSHPCTWEKLSLGRLKMLDLGKLPLHSLKGEGCLQVKILVLPDPLLPNSLSDVAYAAQCISNAGLTIEGCTGMDCVRWHLCFPDHAPYDTASLDLIQTAIRVVKPSIECACPETYAMTHYPLTTTAIINWSSHVLQVLGITADTDTTPWFWEALQSCSMLKEIKITNGVHMGQYTVITGDLHLDGIRTIVQLAAEKLVSVTKRPIVITMKYEEPLSGDLQPLHLFRNSLQFTLPKSIKVQTSSWDQSSTKLIIRLLHE